MSHPSHNDYVAPPPAATPEELKRHVTAPIPPESMREYFSDKEILFVIDYNASRLKSTVFLMYLSNLGMPVDVKLDLNNYDAYSELMKAYFEYPGVVNSTSLMVLAGEIVMYFLNTPVDQYPFASPIDRAFLKRFCDENSATIAQWCIFLDSMVTYIGKVLMPGLINDPADEMAIIDKHDVVGHNVVNLVAAPDFLRTYFTASALKAQIYFKRQFEDPIFGGKKLAYYFLCPSNTVNLLLNKEVVQQMSEDAKAIAQYVQQQSKEAS